MLKVRPKLRSELPPAITTAATYQTCLILSTTLTAVMGSSSRTVIASCSICGCARVLRSHDLYRKCYILRAIWYTYSKSIALVSWDSSCGGRTGPRGAIPIALAFAALTAVFVMKDFTYTGFRVNHAHVYRRQIFSQNIYSLYTRWSQITPE